MIIGMGKEEVHEFLLLLPPYSLLSPQTPAPAPFFSPTPLPTTRAFTSS